MAPASPASVISPIAREHGQVDAHNPSVLKEAGNDAMRARDWKRGMHMFTVAIDMITDSSPPSDAAGWFALDVKSKGVLHVLCSNRSLAHLNLGDTSAATQDAEACCQARPGFAKGHQRLLAALAAAAAPLEERREACARGRRACPTSTELSDAQAALDAEAGVGPEEAIGAAEAAALAAQLASTRLIADDPSHGQHAIAAGDLGSALALGAYGEVKDLVEAERYLRIGAEGGDVGAQRNLGMLLLQSERAAEAATYLRLAHGQGDEEAGATLDALRREADGLREQAIFKLRALATNGDARARAMLEQFEAEGKAEANNNDTEGTLC